MRLTFGSQAPQFETEDIHGKRVALSDYSHDKVMLCFFRYAGCPFCNLSFDQILHYYPRYEGQGLKIIAFFQSPKEHVLRRYGNVKSSVSVIADPDRKIYDLFGVESDVKKAWRSLINIPVWLKVTVGKHFPQGAIDGDLFLMPAQFLIGPPQFTIYVANYGADFAANLTYVEIENFLVFGT